MRKGAPVIGKSVIDGREMFFQTISDASRMTGATVPMLRQAILRGGKCVGRTWRYAKEGENTVVKDDAQVREELLKKFKDCTKELETLFLQSLYLGMKND